MISNALSVHTRRWAESFAERGCDVHLISIRKAGIKGVKVHTVNVGPVNSKSKIWTLLSYVYLFFRARRQIKKLCPDVVNAHYATTHGLIAAFAGVRPLVVSVWGSDVVWDGADTMPFYLRTILKYVFSKADAIYGTSRFLLETIAPFLSAGKKTVHIPFGVDCEVFSPAGKTAVRDGGGEFRIGFVKSLTRKYGPDVLIKAMPKICRAVPDVRLIMAGKGGLKGFLQELANELGVAERVEFVGFVEHSKVADMLRSFDVFVQPSVCEESFGVAVLEASACGAAVVATRVGGVSEVCLDGQTGIMVEPNDEDALADAIITLANDNEKKIRMGKAGREFAVENYNWYENVDKAINEFEKLRQDFAG